MGHRKGYIRKRMLGIILTASFLGNLLQTPDNSLLVQAEEALAEEGAEAVSDNSILYDSEGEEDQSGTAADVGEAVLSEEDCGELSVEMHIGQTTDMESLPEAADAETDYDMPVVLTEASALRLYVCWSSEGDTAEAPYAGALSWDILRGEAGMEPGTVHVANDEVDWTDFETVSDAPDFAMWEDEDEDSPFYQTVMITADPSGGDECGSYYIRAAFQGEENEYLAVVTIPVVIDYHEETAEEEAENVLTAGDTEEETAEENDADLDGAAEEAAIEDTEAALEQESRDDAAKAALEVQIASVEDTEDAEELQEEDAEETVVTISKLSLNKTSAVLNPGDTLKLSAVIVPEGLNQEVAWSSTNESAAAVDSDGAVTALAVGDAEITAVCGGRTASAAIQVVRTDADLNGDSPTDQDGNTIALSDEVWIAGFEQESDDLVYTGGKLTQNLRVYHKGTLLTEKTDFVLTYKNNVIAAAYNAAKAPSVTVTMKGQYTGSRTLYFTIQPQEIDEDGSMGYEQVVQYAKTIKLAAPTLYFNGKKLTANKDFTCDYSSLPAAYTKGDSYEEGAVYSYTVNGIGNFTGSFTMQLAVVRDKNLNLGSATVTMDQKQYEYHGKALTTSDVGIASVKFGNTILDSSLYTYQVYAEGVGTGTVEIYPSEAGRSAGYRGFKTLSIKVVGDRSIKNVTLGEGWQDTIVFSQQQVNTSGGLFQNTEGVLVYPGEDGAGDALTEGVDYTVKYSNHKKVGTATVIFTGIGRYTGSLRKTYKITANVDLEVKWYDTDGEGNLVTVYRKGGASPQFDVLEKTEEGEACVLTNKTDYTVQLKNNAKLGIMTCTITGKGNYKGYQTVAEIEVVAADISQGTITIADKQYSTKANAWKSSVTIKDINGKQLKAGTDYDKNLVYSYSGMEEGLPPETGTIVYVTVYGINNYAGSSVIGSYRIYSTNISKLTIVIDGQEYTGREIELSAEDIHVYASKSDAKKGIEIEETCYEIVGYSNNTKAGTAKVTLRGVGTYGGTRTCSFKISKKQYLTTRVTKVTLEETDISLGVNNTIQLTAQVEPEDAWNQTILWSTSNSKVATVSGNGLVTGLKSGKATITAASQDTGKKATCKVTVSVIGVTAVVLSETSITQYEGTEYQLTATVLPEDATDRTVLWESSNPDIASVDDTGLVSMKQAGMAVITAYAGEGAFSDKCLVIVSREEDDSVPEGDYVTPQEYRSVDDEDDTAAFNRAIQTFNGNYETLYVPAGTYQIDAETGIQLVSKMNLVMSSGAVIKAVGNSSRYYDIILVKEISQTAISGGRIIGERYEHTGTAGEWGHGIGVYDSSVITITDVDISECWGDGIYLGTNRTDADTNQEAGCGVISIQNCRLHDNRRNNMSVVCADYVTIDECSFEDAAGTDPEYGLDIETNYDSNPCEHITISNSTFDGNGQASIGIVRAANDVRIEDCTLNGHFINYAGTNVVISNSVIRGETDARIGISLVNGTQINDGGEEEDVLAASFSAADLNEEESNYTIGEYGIDDSNLMSCSLVEDEDSSSGKALRLERQSAGTQETGYYLQLSELMEDGAEVLDTGSVYRFEYIVKGSGQWGIRTDQTAWYPCVPMSDQFATGIVTYTAHEAESCRVIFYAVDKTDGMWLEIEAVNIYQVK